MSLDTEDRPLANAELRLGGEFNGGRAAGAGLARQAWLVFHLATG
jgi:hypothetical protein